MASIINPLQVSRFLRRYDDAAAQKGIKISMGFNFHEYLSITRATPTKGPTFPNFRPDCSPIESGEGYWILGVDKNNDVALVEAARLYDLSHSNFAEHLESLKAFYADPTAHPQNVCLCTAPSAKKITGKVAYRGDFWVRKDFRGRQGIANIIGGIGRALSFALWAPDFLCSLVEGWTLDKGVYEVTHHEPGGAIIRLEEEDIMEDNWLVWVTGDELRREIELHDRSELAPPSCFSPA
ncbi:hypothetical protein ACM41_11770 [Bradyrhizobium sp. CCBAU 21362]|nr:hypothetical protein [Bradyrhizobium sp. CCBAU 21362]